MVPQYCWLMVNLSRRKSQSFFLESATPKEMKMLEEGGYDLPAWEEEEEGYEEVEEIDSDEN